MHPSTKMRVKRLRSVQLGLRLLELVGALGLLFCAISINKTTGAVSWIVRVAPAVALLHTLYAVYHLSRDVNGRPAASTASYMLFAAMVDCGLIPFLVFSALISHSDYATNAYKWNTLFNIDAISYKIIHAFYLTNITEGGLLVVSLIVGVILATYFRKIAKLPPDMSPLEPNLTARPQHKRNKSELNSTDKIPGKTSPSRVSDTADPNIAGTRRVPFLHTRTDSADSVTLYGNASARNSKATLVQREENEYRRSKRSLIESISRPASAVNPPPGSRLPGSGLESPRARSPETPKERKQKTSSWLSYMKSSDYEGALRAVSGYSAILLGEKIPEPPPISPEYLSKRTTPTKTAESENWYERSAHSSHINLHEQINAFETLQSSPRYGDSLAPDSAGSPPQKKRSREPLAMNPPTPRLTHFAQEQSATFHNAATSSSSPMTPASPQRAIPLQEINTNTNLNHAPQQQLSRGSSFVGSGNKSRFYGTLRRSISSASRHHDDDSENVQLFAVGDDEDRAVSPIDEHDGGSMHSHYSTHSNYEVYPNAADESFAPTRPRSGHGDPAQKYTASQARFQNQWTNGPRQVSNSTGHDLDLQGGYAGLGPEFGKGMAARRREVSGKVVEEGRGGVDQGVGNGNVKKSAGWARFRGL